MSGSIIISNLPLTCNAYGLNTKFAEIGEIKRCFLIKNYQREFTGKAKITYRDDCHADEAVKKFNGSDLDGKVLCVTLSHSEINEPDNKAKESVKLLTKKRLKPDDENSADSLNPPKKKSKSISENNNKLNDKCTELVDEDSTVQQSAKVKHKEQDGRIVVKNVPSQTTEEDVAMFFERFGIIEEVRIPQSNRFKKHNCCVFVQFNSKEEADKAISDTSTNKFMGASVTVECAVPKGKYQQQSATQVIKEEIVDPNAEEDIKEIKVSKKERKRMQKRLSRVIIRNTPFSATEAEVKAFLSSVCKSVTSVEFPAVKGCCFVQLTSPQEAAKAVDAYSLKEMMGRQVVVELAQPKSVYQQQHPADEGADDEQVIKTEKKDPDAPVDATHRSVRVKQERVDPKEWQHSDCSRDIQEGRTLFLSCLAIDTTDFSVKTMLSTFGEVKYVALVTDRLSEQSKGSAFVQFKTREGADDCLAAGSDPSREEELTVDGRTIHVQRAIPRSSASGERSVDNAPKGKDKRNLYLAREGFIREGTQAAAGVSPRDMTMRRLRERNKQQLLADLHRFVSTTRLAVNNLPLTLKDAQLKHIFKQNAPAGAKITEAKVMRYLGQVDATGAAVSRGYGFVTFTKHEHALHALRTVNNNPTIFTDNARPILEFSIESKTALNAREKRLKRSKEVMKAGKTKPGSADASKPVESAANKSNTDDGAAGQNKAFTGYVSKKGDLKAGQKLHKHLGAKIRRRDLASNNKKFSKGKADSRNKKIKSKKPFAGPAKTKNKSKPQKSVKNKK